MHSAEFLTDLYEKTFGENNFNNSPKALYEPVYHIMGMKGKRIRPLLVLMANDAFGGDVKQALNPAFAMEVFHNFTLVHDDIMDGADIRRGEPTVHVKYGVNAGILAGDVMLAYAYQYLCNVPQQHIPGLIQLFNKTAIEIFEGQQMDMDFEQRTDVGEVEYLKMIEYKTSVLLACSLQIGAMLAGASEADQKLIYEFGLNLGLSFQIKDDYLDAFGEAEKVGKKIGGDILNNKKTYLFVSALNSNRRDDLLALLPETNEDKKINSVKALLEESGAKQKTLDKADELYRISQQSLAKVSLSDDAKKPLAKLAELINNREF